MYLPWIQGILKMKLNKFLHRKKQSKEHVLKITDVRGSPTTHNTEIYYQVCGKSVVSSDSPRKLVTELAMIEGFSESDSRLILDLLITELKCPYYSLYETIFCEDKITVKLKDARNNYILTLTLEQILSSNELKKGLSSELLEQLICISYKQQMQNEKRILSKKQQSKRIMLHVYSNQ